MTNPRPFVQRPAWRVIGAAVTLGLAVAGDWWQALGRLCVLWILLWISITGVWSSAVLMHDRRKRQEAAMVVSVTLSLVAVIFWYYMHRR